MKNTALQQLIQWCEEVENSKEYAQSPRLKTGIGMARIKATELLSEEKQDIKNAYNTGYNDGEAGADINTTDVSEFSDADQYFDDTFETTPNS